MGESFEFFRTASRFTAPLICDTDTSSSNFEKKIKSNHGSSILDVLGHLLIIFNLIAHCAISFLEIRISIFFERFIWTITDNLKSSNYNDFELYIYLIRFILFIWAFFIFIQLSRAYRHTSQAARMVALWSKKCGILKEKKYITYDIHKLTNLNYNDYTLISAYSNLWSKCWKTVKNF